MSNIFKVNNKGTRSMSGASIINFKHICTLFYCYYCGFYIAFAWNAKSFTIAILVFFFLSFSSLSGQIGKSYFQSIVQLLLWARVARIIGNLRGNNLNGNRNGNINRRADVAVLPYFMLRKKARRKCKQTFSFKIAGKT